MDCQWIQKVSLVRKNARGDTKSRRRDSSGKGRLKQVAHNEHDPLLRCRRYVSASHTKNNTTSYTSCFTIIFRGMITTTFMVKVTNTTGNPQRRLFLIENTNDKNLSGICNWTIQKCALSMECEDFLVNSP